MSDREIRIAPSARGTAGSPFAADAQGDRDASTRARLEIDLDAVAANWRLAASRHAGALPSAVVKSDAYGLGLTHVARTLWTAGCRMFWVNDIEEALTLRNVLPAAEVRTLLGLAGAEPAAFAAAGVLPALAGTEEIRRAAAHARGAGARMPAAVQIDIGLGRLGLGADEIVRLHDDPTPLSALELRAWVGHLVAFDRLGATENLRARARFLDAAARLPPAPLSLAASSVLWMSRLWHFDVARIGSALHGIRTLRGNLQAALRPVCRLSAAILSVREHPAVDTLGYGPHTRLERPARVATLRLGYADGLPQAFAEFGRVAAGASTAAFVGGMSMSLSMVDVTDLDPCVWRPGARVTVLGGAPRGDVADLETTAAQLGCTPNMLLTQIAAACPRLWSGGSADMVGAERRSRKPERVSSP